MRWIPCTERLPELHTVVVLLDINRWMNTGVDGFDPNWHGVGYLNRHGHPWWSVFGEARAQRLESVTHWMPVVIYNDLEPDHAPD